MVAHSQFTKTSVGALSKARPEHHVSTVCIVSNAGRTRSSKRGKEGAKKKHGKERERALCRRAEKNNETRNDKLRPFPSVSVVGICCIFLFALLLICAADLLHGDVCGVESSSGARHGSASASAFAFPVSWSVCGRCRAARTAVSSIFFYSSSSCYYYDLFSMSACVEQPRVWAADVRRALRRFALDQRAERAQCVEDRVHAAVCRSFRFAPRGAVLARSSKCMCPFLCSLLGKDMLTEFFS
jgi:hypothetical protein